MKHTCRSDRAVVVWSMLVRAVVTSVVSNAQGVGVAALYYITSFWVMGLRLYVVAMCRSRVEMGFHSKREH